MAFAAALSYTAAYPANVATAIADQARCAELSRLIPTLEIVRGDAAAS